MVQGERAEPTHGVSLREAFHVWLRVALLSFGGPAGQIAVMHRMLGGIMAGGLFIVPGIIAIMALSYIYAAYGNVPLVVALFFGLKAAVLAIVLEAVVRVGKRALKNNAMLMLAAAAFIGIFFLSIPFPIIILDAAVIGFVGTRSGLEMFQIGSGHGSSKQDGAVAESLLG